MYEYRIVLYYPESAIAEPEIHRTDDEDAAHEEGRYWIEQYPDGDYQVQHRLAGFVDQRWTNC